MPFPEAARSLVALPLALAFALAFAAGCSSARSAEVNGCAEGGTPLTTQTSKAGTFDVAVCTTSQPPVQDQMAGEITVRDAKTGAPVDGLTLAVTPWMPEMGHGQSLAVTVTPKGHGVYAISPLAFFMAGEWELDTKIEGAVDDTASPSFFVP